MKCNSCSETISAKMKNAVDKNLCPFCGDKILPDDLKKDVVLLDDVLTRLFASYEEFTFDFLKDKFGIGVRNTPSAPSLQMLSKAPTEITDDMPLVEKLKNKRFREQYLKENQEPSLANSLSTIAKKVTGFYDDSHESNDDDTDQYDKDYLDPALERYVQDTPQQYSQSQKPLTPKESQDLAKLNKIMAESKGRPGSKFAGMRKSR